MGSEKDRLSSCPEADELLPARSAESGSSSALQGGLAYAEHVSSCPRCSDLARAREVMAAELRRLPRASASGASAVDFGVVMRAVDGTLDAELLRGETRWRPRLADLERIAMPADVSATVAARALGIEAAGATRRARILAFVRRAAAVAAAAGLVAAALLSRQAAPAQEGLAAETRRLSDSKPIEVEIIDVPAPTDAAGAVRLLGSSLLAPRGGGP